MPSPKIELSNSARRSTAEPPRIFGSELGLVSEGSRARRCVGKIPFSRVFGPRKKTLGISAWGTNPRQVRLERKACQPGLYEVTADAKLRAGQVLFLNIALESCPKILAPIRVLRAQLLRLARTA